MRRKGSSAGASPASKGPPSSTSMELDPGLLSEGEADVLSSNYNSPAGVSFGSGSSGRNRGGGPRGSGSLYPGSDR